MTIQPGSAKERLIYFALLTRFDKPIGTFLLLWPTLWALWIAGAGKPDTYVTIVFVLGVILMRAAGCIINDYADRNIDGQVARTRHRPLVTGKISGKEALMLFAALCLVAFCLVLTLNWLTIGLSFVAVILAILYPFMKRHTYMPQAFLGLAFGWSVPMAFAAQTGGLPDVTWLLLTATVLWATAYDTLYAMVDREDDLQIGVKSTAILFGEADKLVVAVIQVTFILTMMIIGGKLEMSMYYYLGLSAASALMIYQQYLIRDREPDQCFKAFLNNNWVGLVIFAGIVSHYFVR
ncbi:MAG: 4-hydroxybenzoate octaprenyltransferase [Gammaproteobacteria bacterium]|nr:4-hydroxybenzoate octaprenyltransferase [Gammaproteobacteria bacterium]